MRGINKAHFVKIWLLLLLFSLGYSPKLVRAQINPQILFDRANDQLESGDYQKALSTYKTIQLEGNVSGSLYLNMGISYVQLDSLGKAKYYFLKARQFEQTRTRAEEGIQYVDSRFSRQSAVLPKLPWERFFDWLGTVTGPTTLLGIGIILLNLGVFLFVGAWFLPSFENPLRYGSVGTGIISLLFLFSSFYLSYIQNRYSQAVMVQQQAEVLEQPASDATLVSQAYEGYSFTVDRARSREQPGWAYVRMSKGLYGWIPDNEIMVL